MQAFKDAIIFTIPSANIDSISSNQGLMGLKLRSLYTQEFDEQFNNTIELNIPNFLGNIKLTSNNYGFIFDETPMSETDKIAIFDKLAKIRDISICQVALHFSSPITANDLQSILLALNADQKYTWVVIDTGPMNLKSKYGFNESWGFPMNIELNGENTSIKNSTVSQAASDFQKEMIFLQSQTKYLGNKNLEAESKYVTDYLQENGIKIKGVMLVAPTKNICEYRNNTLISKIDVIKAELDYKMEY